MTRLFLNNEEVQAPPPTLSSLEEVIKHVERNLLPPNTVIRTVNLDGLPVDAGNSQADPSMLLGDLTNRERIEIFTCTLKEIALDSVREAGLYLDRVEALTPSLAASFRDYPGPETFESLKQLYDGFYWLNLLLGRLEGVLEISLDRSPESGISLKEHNQKFVSVLQQLVVGQEQEDFILIADLLVFEVLPMIPALKSIFAEVAALGGGRS